MPHVSRLTRFSVCGIAALAISCTGAQKNQNANQEKGSQAAPTSRDQVLRFGEAKLQGIRFEPDALGHPAMPRAHTRRRHRRHASLARARKKAARALKSGRPDAVHVLVSMLWDAAAKAGQSDPDKATALRKEALTDLTKLRDKEGSKVDPATMEMLGAAYDWLGKPADAAQTYTKLLKKHPKVKQAQMIKTWLADIYLRQGKVDAAAKALAGIKASDAKLNPMTAYVLAWTKFRTGDDDAARTLIARAAKTWKQPDRQTQTLLVRDLLLIIARTGTPPKQADKILSDVVHNSLKARYALLYKLNQGYKFAGYYGLASKTLDYLMNDVLKGAKVPPNDEVTFRYEQSDYEYRLNHPDKAAEHAIQAYKALATCTKCPPATKEAVTRGISDLAGVFHNAYATSLDTRYYAPAVKLYKFYLTIPNRADAAKARREYKDLQATKAHADPSNGKHDASVMRSTLLVRSEVFKACYEQQLGREPNLEGSINLVIQVTDQGTVKKVETTPAPGKSGMAAVASCITKRIKGWSFPGRSLHGLTAMVLPLAFSPKSEAAAAKAKASAKPAAATAAKKSAAGASK